MRKLKKILKGIGQTIGMGIFISILVWMGWLFGRIYEQQQAANQFDWLIDRIWRVESSERIIAPEGAAGEMGPLQIHRDALDDVNRWYGTRFEISDLKDITTAKQIARLYMKRWMDFHRDEIAARIFNGGPRGWEKESTKDYWLKINHSRKGRPMAGLTRINTDYADSK